MDLFHNDTEIRIFMDLASKVILLPAPLNENKVINDRLPLTETLDHLRDANELKKTMPEGRLGNVLRRYKFAVQRVPYTLLPSNSTQCSSGSYKPLQKN